jgi:hypothetical protein
MKCGFSIEFSTILSPNRVLTTLKSASFEIRILSVVHHSQTFVWDGYNFAPSAAPSPPPGQLSVELTPFERCVEHAV